MPGDGDRLPHVLRVGLLWVAALAAYANSFGCDFALDSKAHVLLDPRIRTMQTGGLIQIFTLDYWFPNAESGLYRPVTTLSYLFNYAVLGNAGHPAGYHWINFGLHCLNIALVYLLALRIFRAAGPALATAAIWGLHPAATEAVTNVSGRADLLAAACVLGGLLCHIHGSVAGGGRRRLWRIALGAIAVAGVLSKESFAILPVVMLLYDLTFPEEAGWWARHMGYVVVLLPVIPFAVIRARVRAELPSGLALPFVDNPLIAADFWTARLTAVKVIGKDLWLLAFPRDLSCDYSYNQIPLVRWPWAGWEDWQALVALAVCAAAAVAAIRCYRRARPAFFFIVFFFAALIPTSNLVVIIGSMRADRFLYLPAVGFAACLVMGMGAIARRIVTARAPADRLAAAVLAIVCVAFGCRTFARNRDWQNDLALWSSAAKVSPASFRTHRALAADLVLEGTIDQAMAEMERCLAILDGLPDRRNAAIAYAQAGLIYRKKGDLVADPQNWYRQALSTLTRAEAIDKATDRANRTAARIAPSGLPDLYVELAIVYRRLRQPEKAVEALRYARLLDPSSWPVYNELAETYVALGQSEQAVTALLEGMRMSPQGFETAARLAGLYAQMDPGCEAFLSGQGGARLNLQCDLLHRQVCASRRDLAQLFAGLGQKGMATRLGNEAAELGCR